MWNVPSLVSKRVLILSELRKSPRVAIKKLAWVCGLWSQEKADYKRREYTLVINSANLDLFDLLCLLKGTFVFGI
jgi:hypothetical protein